MRNILIVALLLSSFLLVCTVCTGENRHRTKYRETKEASAIDIERKNTIEEDEKEEARYKINTAHSANTTGSLVVDSSPNKVDTNPSKSNPLTDKDMSPKSDERNEGSEGGFFIRNFWALLSMLFLVVIYVVLNNRIRNNHDKIRNIAGELNNLKINQSSGFQNRSNQKEDLEKLRKLNERIDGLESFIYAERNANKSTSVDGNEEKEDDVTEGPVVVDLPITKKEDVQPTVFYMATPIEEKMFDARSASDVFVPTRTLYKFIVDETDVMVSFEFYADELGIKDAVNYPQRYITPVCEPQNPLNQNAKKIKTIDEGRAKKQGDKWVVTQKAKIRYE